MRRVPPPPAGILGAERGQRRLRHGRQVRAAVRRAALHRDARHGAPLKSPVSSEDSFSPCDSRGGASCYPINPAIGGQRAAKFLLLGQIEVFRFFFSPFFFADDDYRPIVVE